MTLHRKTAIRVLLPTGALLAAIWGVAAAWAYAQRQEAIDNHFLISRQLNSAVAEHFNGILQLVEISLDAAANELAARERGSPAAAGHLLSLVEDLRKKSGDLVDIAVAHPDGTVEVVRTAETTSVNTGDRDYFMAQMAGSPPGMFIGAPIESRINGRWVIPLTVVPRKTEKGIFPFAVIRIDSLAALHEQQRMPSGGAIGVVRTDGKWLSRAPMEARVLSASFSGLKEFTTVWLKHGRGVYMASHGLSDNKPRLISFYLLNDYNLFVYVSTELERVLDPWKRRVTVVASGLATVTAILLMGAFYLIGSLKRTARSRQRFIDISEIASDLIFELDVDLRITFVSNRYFEIFGFERDDILGRTASELGWLPLNAEVGDQLTAAIKARRSFSDLAFRCNAGNLHHKKMLAMSAKPLFGEHHSFLGYRGVATDITERVRQQEERELRAAREAQASKLEALGQLAGGIAHDFNNLLGAILGFAHFLVEDTPPDSVQRRYAERVVMAGQRGRGLVQQILTFSRRIPGDPTDVRVADVLRETYELLCATIPATTHLVIENDGGDLMVTGDRSQLGQVLVNLCINASDALDEHPGEVRISVSPLDPTQPELVRLPNCVAKPTPSTQSSWSDDDGFGWIGTGGLITQDNVCIRVSDTGSGIPREHFASLFDLFFTTKGNGGGTGLGLPVVQSVVTGHGGAILVRTKAGSGTTFEIILPRAISAFVGPDTVVATSERPSHKSATILVIDDDRDFCDMLETALRRLGYEAVSAHDPIEGLAAIEDDPSLWDLVVTDQTMPKMKGAEVICRIKQIRPTIHCIICTGYSSSLGEPEALAAGADGFCSKPIDLDVFGALVNQLLSRSG